MHLATAVFLLASLLLPFLTDFGSEIRRNQPHSVLPAALLSAADQREVEPLSVPSPGTFSLRNVTPRWNGRGTFLSLQLQPITVVRSSPRAHPCRSSSVLGFQPPPLYHSLQVLRC